MNSSKALLLLIVIYSIALVGCVSSPKILYTEDISLNKCWFKSKPDWPDSKCGVLTVPENYSQPDGKKVRLPFIIFKSEKSNSKTFPLVIAGGGGPGGALGISEDETDTLDESLWLTWYASTIESGRDLILIDNRGVGSSMPRLSCYEVQEADMSSLDKSFNSDDYVSMLNEYVIACKERLQNQGVDITQYHVINAAKGLESLRIGLGLKQINVYGISYGTRVALEFERQYPDSTHALILDGIYPQSIRVFDEAPRRDYEAVSRVIRKCQADSQCDSQFGFELDTRLIDFLEQLEKEPITISMTSPIDYKPIDVIVTPDVFFDSLFTMVYDEYTIRYIPKYLYSAMRGNTDHFTEMVRDYYVKDIVINPIDEGAYASYSCFDESAFIDYDKVKSEIRKYPYQHYSNEIMIETAQPLCKAWGMSEAPAEFKDSYKINTPVLIYSGELDPVTPAEFAKPVINNARVSWSKVWPNMAHGVMAYSDCADWTAGEFLDDPESDPFVYECSEIEEKYIFEL